MIGPILIAQFAPKQEMPSAGRQDPFSAQAVRGTQHAAQQRVFLIGKNDFLEDERKIKTFAIGMADQVAVKVILRGIEHRILRCILALGQWRGTPLRIEARMGIRAAQGVQEAVWKGI